jgi:hypothetical protein
MTDQTICFDSYNNPIKLGAIYEATYFSNELQEGEQVQIISLELVHDAHDAGYSQSGFQHFQYDKTYIIAKGLVLRNGKARIVMLRQLNRLKPIGVDK